MDNAQTLSTTYYDRIRSFTPKSVNKKIDEKTEQVIKDVIAMGPEAIHARLDELTREWDIDRVLMVNFSVIVFAQLVAARKNKRWLRGPLIQAPLLFMHATLGWCPPLLWFRPLGVRTKQEIAAERDVFISYLSERKLH